jgi:hypothetical protein
MGFISNVVNRIRSAWTRDKEQVPLQLAKGAMAAGFPTSGYDLLQAYGYDILGDYLRLEQDLLSRFVDYEEMDDYPEINAAIDIFADDATQPDTQINRTVWVTSPDKNIEQIGNRLFQKQLRMDEEIWEIARTVVKYGNDYEELLVTGEGVVGLNFMPPPTVRRIEGPRGELFGFVQDFQGRFGYSPEEFKHILAKRTAALQGVGPAPGSNLSGMDDSVAALEDWEVVHFRLRGKHRRSVYGYSVLDGARWIFKRLLLLEDSALIYRLQRAPERFAFYIDVGDLPPAEALAYVNRVRQQYKKKKFVNPSTGNLDLKFDSLAQDEDIFLPMRQGQEGTRVDVLAGPVWQHMEDIEYFQNKLFSSLKIPKAYLAQDENTARAVLSSEDVRFARTVLRIQRELQNGLRKIFRVHLAALGYDPHKLDYEVHMTVPSSIFELAQLEVRNARADLAGRLGDFFPLYWIYKTVFNCSDEEIEDLTKKREEQVKNDAVWAAKAEAEAQKAAAPPAPPAAPGGAPAPGAPPQMQQLANARTNINRSRFLRSGAKGISERELMAGYRPSDSARLEDKLNTLLKRDRALAASLGQLQDLVHGLSRSQRR